MEEIAVQVLRALVHSSTLENFFEKLSANLWNIEPIRGFQLYVPASPGTLQLAYGYTHESIDVVKTLELSESSCCAIAFNQRALCRDLDHGPMISCPVENNGLVAGVFSLHLMSVEGISRLCENDLRSISIAVSAFLQNGSGTVRTFSRKTGAATQDPTRLTDRQAKILGLLNTDRTYHQIARELHVSESLIKLEISRIFKFLGVRSKAEAIGAAEGYLAVQAPPPPAI